MRLQTKLAFYNSVSKIIIILGFGALLPSIVNRVAINHIDSRLYAKKEKVMKIIHRGDIKELKEDEDCSFGNYNLLKEEFISITPVTKLSDTIIIFNDLRDVGGDIVDFRILSSTFKYDNQPYNLELGAGLGSIHALNKTLQNITLLVMLIVTLITLLLDIGFMQILLNPLRRIIREKLIKTMHPNTFDFSAVQTSTDDFRYLDDSINGMMRKVQDAFLLEKEFMANVSHELLTPISILQNRFDNLISEGNLSSETARKIVDSQKTLSRLGKIIKALLMISNIENEQYLKEDSIELKEFVTEVVNEIQERLSEKNIRINFDWKADHIMNSCNRSLMFNLFFNLINNAIKYNKADGSVTISGEIKDGCYLLTFADTGRGIPEDQLPVIFNRFKRFKKIDNESYGLGLPIVKTIAAFHDIEIEVHSKVGEGTQFLLKFKK